ncbi:MAG: 4-hydroxythreonine-4-phosphate dehydrogenase PdxA [Bacteriovoracaceae bacterium]
MIYVSQGHELGIGLEVFLKSFLHLSQLEQREFTLICNSSSLRQTIDSLSLPYKLTKNELQLAKNITLKIKEAKKISPFQSTDSLVACLEVLKKKDILFTLPTSKDQLILGKKKLSGHTEFFRHYYKKDEISMLFYSPNIKLFLITDHLALKKVGDTITSSLIARKVSLVLKESKKYKLGNFTEVLFSGINPHVGENGILGNEDSKIFPGIKKLKTTFPKITFLGPISGDILSLKLDPLKEQLLVYMFHDQGLSFFKSQMGLLGINISLGLPNLRTSVDHGTAFDLYGKNQANFSGCLYVIKEMMKLKGKSN